MIIDILYVIFFIIALYLLINTPLHKYNDKWLYKTIIFHIGVFIYVASIFITIDFVNKYLIPIIIFMNILTLIYITYIHKFSLLNLLGIICIPYLLYIFNYKDFEMKNGLLVNPNKKWIYLHVIFLTIFYFCSDYLNKYNSIGLILLIWYPLLFPINEYWKHRIFTLFLAGVCNWYFL